MDESILDTFAINEKRLIIGNHESLLIFGSEVQAKLRYFSKTIAGIIMHSNDELEISINNVLSNMETAQKQHGGGVFRLIYSSSKRREATIKSYRQVLVYMDKMTVCLQKQQAQLLKDSVILGHMEVLIKECICTLEQRVHDGESTLELSRKKLLSIKDSNKKRDLEVWNDRLQRKIEALRISYVVSLQSLEQLHLIQENNAQIIDGIVSSVSGTIPIWRNQMAFLLGLEKLEQNLEKEQKIAQAITGRVESVTHLSRKSSSGSSSTNYQEIVRANEKLVRALNELLLIENRETQIRFKMMHTLQQE